MPPQLSQPPLYLSLSLSLSLPLPLPLPAPSQANHPSKMNPVGGELVCLASDSATRPHATGRFTFHLLKGDSALHDSSAHWSFSIRDFTVSFFCVNL